MYISQLLKEAQVHLEQRGLDEMSIGHLGRTEPEARRRAEQVLSQYFIESTLEKLVISLIFGFIFGFVVLFLGIGV